MDASAYLDQLQALLPQGAAWPRGTGAVLTRLLLTLAAEWARADRRAADLLDEADPRTTRELLADWERVCGLPDPCAAGIATALQERRAAVLARLTATGGQSVDYFTRLAAALGYAVEIGEWRPFIAGWSRCGDRLSGPPATRFYWRVTVLGPRVTRFRTGASQCGDRLGKIARAEDLECLLRRLQPAHGALIFGYQGA